MTKNIIPNLIIKNLIVEIRKKNIIKNLNLTINPGEVHAIMGPNGSGKSTLAKTITKHNEYKIIKGKIIFKNNDITNTTPEKCAQNGIFLSFQHPVEISGITNIQFLKTIVNSKNKLEKKEQFDTIEFLKKIKNYMKNLKMKEDLLYRSINENFSGGEKKRNEILQLILLNPKLIILDEIDSGLDIDSLKNISSIINILKNDEKSIIIITHYKRLLNYIKPNFIHILMNGKIIHSDEKSLASKLERKGYKWLYQKYIKNKNLMIK